MAYGRGRLGDLHATGDPGVRSDGGTSSRATPVQALGEVVREAAVLRSINAHLRRQLALLRQREAQALRLADRDALTGLYNRRRLHELLDASLGDAVRRDYRVGLLFVDLDGFKSINDRHGHAVGDKLLITVASRIAARARQGDFVCRYGGDEFVVVLPRIASPAAVQEVAVSISKRVSVPCRIDGLDLNASAAIGLSIYPDDATGAAELLQRADDSMYSAKSASSRPIGPTASGAMLRRRRDDRPKRRLT